jgi:putative amidoligase enzyme
MSAEMVLPPSLDTEDGQPRMIGVEIEFAGMSCEQAAGLICDLFSGRIKRIDPHRFEVTETRFGSFTVELDSQYAHPDDNDDDAAASSWDDIGRAVRDGLTTAIATVTSLWLPIEIVSPPVPLAVLPELDSLVPALRGRGAAGCSDGLVYAFATQLNPEVPSLRAESMLAHLKAFLLLAETLRAAIDVDLLRRALPFANAFPSAYVRKVVNPKYQPALPQLVDDYLEANQTRNRELDLLPLFTHLAHERVRAKVEDALIKPRPTFHYRLPDTRVSDPAWSLIVEWNRWVEVEHLAADASALRRLGEIYLDQAESRRPRALVEAIDAWRAERSAGR